MDSEIKKDYIYGIALTAKRPTGGWVIVEDGIQLSGSNHDDLVRKLRKFRNQRNKPVGDCDYDVRKAICEANPHLCTVVDSKPVAVKEKSLNQKASEWLLNVTKTQYIRAIPDVKEERSKVCQSCPHNKVNLKPESDYSSHEYRVNISTKGKIDNGLGVCEVHCHDNRVAVWILNVPSKENQPEHCWAKTND